MSADRDRDDESGQFERQITDEKIFEVFENRDTMFLTAPQVAEALGVTRPAIYPHLKRLVDEEEVHKEEVNDRQHLYSRTQERARE
jgi:predicted ArsR family transcriptional regulator